MRLPNPFVRTCQACGTTMTDRRSTTVCLPCRVTAKAEAKEARDLPGACAFCGEPRTRPKRGRQSDFCKRLCQKRAKAGRIPRTCDRCGITVTHFGRPDQRAFCTTECAYADQLEAQRRTAAAKPPRQPIDCPGCGITFTPRGQLQRFHSKSCHERARWTQTAEERHAVAEHGRMERAAAREVEREAKRPAREEASARREIKVAVRAFDLARREFDRAMKRVWKAHNRPPVLTLTCEQCGGTFQTTYLRLTCTTLCSRRLSSHKTRMNRRARERDAFVETVYRRRIFERDGWRCQICGKKVRREALVPDPLAPTIDHIIPLAGGGTHEPVNVQTAHFICNSLKSDVGPGQLRWLP